MSLREAGQGCSGRDGQWDSGDGRLTVHEEEEAAESREWVAIAVSVEEIGAAEAQCEAGDWKERIEVSGRASMGGRDEQCGSVRGDESKQRCRRVLEEDGRRVLC